MDRDSERDGGDARRCMVYCTGALLLLSGTPGFLLCSVVSFYSGERERVGQYQSERGKGVVLPIVGHLGTVQLV
jgi:hypothetical protein